MSDSKSKKVVNKQCALGVQANGSGHVRVTGDITVRLTVKHVHTEECQVDRFIRNVQEGTDEVLEFIDKGADRVGKQIARDFNTIKDTFWN